MNKKLKKHLTKRRGCGKIKAYQGRDDREKIERNDAELSVNRKNYIDLNPERKTERENRSMVDLKEKGASPMNHEVSEMFICFALKNR